MCDFDEKDYKVLNCDYCGHKLKAFVMDIHKTVQRGAKNLGIIEAVLLFGCCPKCLTVKVSGKDKPVAYVRQAEKAGIAYGAEASLPLQIFDWNCLENIRSNMTDLWLFVFNSCYEAGE